MKKSEEVERGEIVDLDGTTFAHRLRRGLVVFAMMFFITSGTAIAADASDTTTTIKLSALLTTVLVSYAIPIFTGLFTKVNASAGVKQAVTGLLAAINGFLVNATMDDGSAVFTKEALLLASLSFMLSLVSYGQLWKPHDINAKLAPDKGIG